MSVPPVAVYTHVRFPKADCAHLWSAGVSTAPAETIKRSELNWATSARLVKQSSEKIKLRCSQGMMPWALTSKRNRGLVPK